MRHDERGAAHSCILATANTNFGPLDPEAYQAKDAGSLFPAMRTYVSTGHQLGLQTSAPGASS